MKTIFSRANLIALVVMAALSLSGISEAGYKKSTSASIYETAKRGGFTTLAAAIEAAGLEETLKKKGPFTVFAPTDEAFAKLPEGTVEALLEDKEALANILLYHVVSGKVMASDVVGLESAKMLNGQDVSIDTKKGVKINGANVVKTDVMAKNGVIHVIDTVLLPPAEKSDAGSM